MVVWFLTNILFCKVTSFIITYKYFMVNISKTYQLLCFNLFMDVNKWRVYTISIGYVF